MLKETIKQKGMLFSKQTIYEPELLVGAKAIKQENKEKLTITYNNTDFQADTLSIIYMTSVIAIANANYAQAVKVGSTTAYNDVYKSTIKWKCVDNVIRDITVEDIINICHLAMGSIANIIGT